MQLLRSASSVPTGRKMDFLAIKSATVREAARNR